MKRLTSHQAAIVACLSDRGPSTEAELAEHLDRHPASISSTAKELEIKGLISRVPGMGGARKWRAT